MLRFVLADTEQLHNKLVQMSNRICQLEDAVLQLHRQIHSLTSHEISSAPPVHPHLAPELLKIKTLQEMLDNPDIVTDLASATGKLRSEPSDSDGVAGAADRGSKPPAAGSSDYVEAFGTLVIGDDGAGWFYRRSGAQEVRSCHIETGTCSTTSN